MDAFYALPAWAQLLLAFLVGGVLVLLNVGWLIQARGWLERQGQQRQSGSPAATPKRERV